MLQLYYKKISKYFKNVTKEQENEKENLYQIDGSDCIGFYFATGSLWK